VRHASRPMIERYGEEKRERRRRRKRVGVEPTKDRQAALSRI
jgi:hypothetical protein